MRVEYHKSFLRCYKKVTREIKELFIEKEEIFRQNPFDHRLGTHKLHGNLDGSWSFYLRHGFRVLFIFTEDQETATFYFIGPHDQAYR